METESKTSRWVHTKMMTAVLTRFVDQGWVNLIGGCCGTTSAHIKAFHALAEGRHPRPHGQHADVFAVSGIEYLEITEEIRLDAFRERSPAQRGFEWVAGVLAPLL